MEIPPIHTLPDEVLGKIFSLLSQGEIITSVLPVCQRWQAVAQSEVLSRGLEFLQDDAVPTEKAVHLIQDILNLKSLRVRRRPDTVQLLQAAGSCCTELRRMRVEHYRGVSNNHSALTAALTSVFRSCEQLTDLTLWTVDMGSGPEFCEGLCSALCNLRRLRIDCSWFGPAELNAMLDNCPQMEEFHATCPLSDANVTRMVQRWGSSLQLLALQASNLTDAGLAALAGCPQLKTLVLCKLRTPGAGLVQLASLSRLENLVLFVSVCVVPENIQEFIGRSCSAGRLRKISFWFFSGVDDNVLTALAAACPCLESLSLAHCKRFSAVGAREVLRSCRRLLRLNVFKADPNVEQIVPELPQLAPQLRWLNIDGDLLSSMPCVVANVQARIPGLEICSQSVLEQAVGVINK